MNILKINKTEKTNELYPGCGKIQFFYSPEGKKRKFFYSPEGEKKRKSPNYILHLRRLNVNYTVYGILGLGGLGLNLGLKMLVNQIKDPWFTRRGRHHPCPQEFIDGITLETYKAINKVLFILNTDEFYDDQYVDEFKEFLKTDSFYRNFSFKFELENE